jgi:hypothetical protein
MCRWNQRKKQGSRKIISVPKAEAWLVIIFNWNWKDRTVGLSESALRGIGTVLGCMAV